MNIEFIYKDNLLNLKITNIIRKTKPDKRIFVEFELNNKKYIKLNRSILYLKFNDILNEYNFKYKVGEIVKVKSGYIKILENLRITIKSKTCKACKYICLNDYVISTSIESNIAKGEGCAVCSNHKIVKGINDISTTHPEYVKFFLNEEDCYSYSIGTDKKLYIKCPFCGHVFKDRPYNISQGRFLCKKCTVSNYKSERIMAYILEKIILNIPNKKYLNGLKIEDMTFTYLV